MYIVLAYSKKREAISFAMWKVITYLLLFLSVNLLLPGVLSPTLINIRANSSEFHRTTSSWKYMTQKVSFWYKTVSKIIHTASLQTYRLSQCTSLGAREWNGICNHKYGTSSRKSTNAIPISSTIGQWIYKLKDSWKHKARQPMYFRITKLWGAFVKQLLL